jgi:hypothetical protein
MTHGLPRRILWAAGLLAPRREAQGTRTLHVGEGRHPGCTRTYLPTSKPHQSSVWALITDTYYVLSFFRLLPVSRVSLLFSDLSGFALRPRCPGAAAQVP